MKKLLVLPALGAAAALTYGAAAALNVKSEGAPLQVGVTYDLACAEGAAVTGWGLDDKTEPTVSWVYIDVKDINANCDGQTMFATALKSNGDLVAGANSRGSVILKDDGDGVTRYQVKFGAPLLAEQVEGIRISIAGDRNAPSPF